MDADFWVTDFFYGMRVFRMLRPFVEAGVGVKGGVGGAKGKPSGPKQYPA